MKAKKKLFWCRKKTKKGTYIRSGLANLQITGMNQQHLFKKI